MSFRGVTQANRCTARAKRSGKRCQNPSIRGKDKCRHHGGLTPIRHGLCSKYPVPRLADKIKQAKKDNRHLDIEEKIATTCALIDHLGEQISAGPVEVIGERGKTVQCDLVQFTPRLVSLLDTLTKQIERYHRIKYGQKHTITYERLDFVLNQIIQIVGELVPNKEIRSEIARRFRTLKIPEYL